MVSVSACRTTSPSAAPDAVEMKNTSRDGVLRMHAFGAFEKGWHRVMSFYDGGSDCWLLAFTWWMDCTDYRAARWRICRV